MARMPRRPARVSLICIDRFPGIERFVGLGQLDARQLSTLVERKEPVTNSHFDLAVRAWAAFRAPDPVALVRLARERPDALPFLADALRRLLAEYPSSANGLSTTARHAMEAMEEGPLDGGALFQRTQDREDRPFMGDRGFFDVIGCLASARTPLVRIDPEGVSRDLRGRRVSLTAAGRRVLHGDADAVALNGIDQWRGGVHLFGADSSPWRWDPARETLVSWSSRS